METEIQRLLEALADLREQANVNAVFGEPVTVEGRTVIPVAKVAYGFGMGIGHASAAEEGATEGAGDSGGGDRVSGGGCGGVRVESVVDEQKVALAVGLLASWTVFWLARALVKIFGRQT